MHPFVDVMGGFPNYFTLDIHLIERQKNSFIFLKGLYS